uniref:Uncharacterized protein n=1 Tax=Canis lupus familiaris TaxID=9615 RepID=A0A8C0YS60_CANLF
WIYNLQNFSLLPWYLHRGPPTYEMLKEEHEVAVLEALQSSTPAMPDHIFWSLFNTIFLNWCCLGFAAFAYSVKSRGRKLVGDMTKTQTYVSTSKCLNIWALGLGLPLTITFIIFLATSSLMIFQTISEIIKHGGT